MPLSIMPALGADPGLLVLLPRLLFCVRREIYFIASFRAIRGVSADHPGHRNNMTTLSAEDFLSALVLDFQVRFVLSKGALAVLSGPILHDRGGVSPATGGNPREEEVSPHTQAETQDSAVKTSEGFRTPKDPAVDPTKSPEEGDASNRFQNIQVTKVSDQIQVINHPLILEPSDGISLRSYLEVNQYAQSSGKRNESGRSKMLAASQYEFLPRARRSGKGYIQGLPLLMVTKSVYAHN